MKDKILELAIEQFSMYGVRSITMDDIARLMGVSKKTLYQEFRDKKDLVKEAIARMLEKDQEKMIYIMEHEDGVIEHLVKISKLMRERLSNINPIAIMEIQKYFPEAWQLFDHHREEVILVDLINILEKGKKLGYFRSEIDSAILARMRVNQISSAMDSSNFQQKDFNLVTVQMEMMEHFLHGIFTEKGRQAYQTQKANQERIVS